MGSLYKAETVARWKFQFCSEILQSGSPTQYVNVFSSENYSGKGKTVIKKTLILLKLIQRI